MAGKKIKWFLIARDISALNFADNHIAVADCDGKLVCIGKHEQRLFAFAYKCPHASGMLANGFIDAIGNIVCPVHRYKFSLINGRNTSGEGYYLKTYPVETRDDGIYAGIEESSFSLW
jgi:nitrite reductase/ring-hydroxylating ferredoxin subunit